MAKERSTPPTPSEIGARIVRNIDRVQGFLDTVNEEIKDVHKLPGAGTRQEWTRQAQELEESLVELRKIVTESDLGKTL